MTIHCTWLPPAPTSHPHPHPSCDKFRRNAWSAEHFSSSGGSPQFIWACIIQIRGYPTIFFINSTVHRFTQRSPRGLLPPSLPPSRGTNLLVGASRPSSYCLSCQKMVLRTPRGSAQRDRKPLLRVVQSKDTPSRSHRQRSAGPTALYQSYLHPPWMEPG